MSDPNPSVTLRLCRWLRFGSFLFVAAVVAIYVATWCWPEFTLRGHGTTPRIHIAGLPVGALVALSAGERLMVAALSFPYLAALLWAFRHLDRMLRGFERREFFERATVGHLRAFAGYLLLAKLLALAAMHLRVALAVHLLGREKFHAVAFNLSADDLSILLLCALLFVIARMMEEGRRLAEENREFV